MRFETRGELASWLLRVKASIALFTPVLAWAAERSAAERVVLGEMSGWTWSFVAGFSLLGWAVADLDKMAELWNVEGKRAYELWRDRLKFVKGIAASNAAGIMTFFVGHLAPDWLAAGLGVGSEKAQLPEMLVFVFVTGAGYMGVRWFDWLERKVFK